MHVYGTYFRGIVMYGQYGFLYLILTRPKLNNTRRMGCGVEQNSGAYGVTVLIGIYIHRYEWCGWNRYYTVDERRNCSIGMGMEQRWG
jgi:hypothetical protein